MIFNSAEGCRFQPGPLLVTAVSSLALTTSSLSALAKTGTKRALLVGVEYSDSDTPRAQKTRDYDIGRFSDLLAGTFGFQRENILRLSAREATTKGVVAAFENHLIRETKPSDVVVFLYTGHGTQVSDFSGDEGDGLDEALCTFDFIWSDPETWLTDDILASLISRVPTNRVLVINTACHSGTSTRGGEIDADAPQIDGVNSGFQPRPGKVSEKEQDDLFRPEGAADKQPVLLAGCASDEVSYRSDVRPVGALFLSALLPELKRDGARLTFRTAVTRISPQLEKTGRDSARANKTDIKPQTPQAEGPIDQRIQEFLTPPPLPKETPTATPTPIPSPVQPWQKQSGDIAITLNTDKLTYAEGDLVEVTVTADLDCQLRLFYLSADHQTYQIFPNQHQPDASVKKGVPIHLGSAGGPFKLRAKAPFGNEILMAIASSRPFTDAESFRFQSDLVKEFRNTNLEALSHRGIGIEAGDAPLVGRALRLYRVEAKK